MSQEKNIFKACKEFDLPRSTYYEWKSRHKKYGDKGFLRIKEEKEYQPRIDSDVVNKILGIRKEFQMGPIRIKWYLERYHDINISESSVYRILAKFGVNRLGKTASRRTLHTKRYNKTSPGHHVQMDVRFLIFKAEDGKKTKRYQYTAIDDATRIRVLKIYEKHNQKSAIDFVNYVIERFPFRIHTIRTDRGHEFQAKFHWYVEDQGIRHVYIKPKSPQLNGKVERSHRTDKDEFYQLLSYKDDVNLEEKNEAWENFYNRHRPQFRF
jgi:transposase InsO family protein